LVSKAKELHIFLVIFKHVLIDFRQDATNSGKKPISRKALIPTVWIKDTLHIESFH
jgi:hypothetical protein